MRSGFVLPAALVVGSILTVTVLFQNCGGGVQAARPSNYSSSVNPPTPGGPPAPGGANFRKNELFNPNYLPNKTPMLETMLTGYNYQGYSGAKAVAITQTGLGFVTRKPSGSQADANQAALEGCYAISQGQPCALIATGDVFNYSLAELSSKYTFTMQTPLQLSATAIPFVNSAQRAQVANDYGVAPSPKALAISIDGAYSWASNSATLPLVDINEARRLALERCEMMAAVTPCTLVAENNTMVFTPNAINRTPAIDYYKATLADAIPGMRAAVFNVQMNQDYIPKVDRTEKGVVYITADGRGGYAVSASAATSENDANAACQGNAGSQPCFRYAINRVIQPLQLNLVAIKNYSMDLHCKTVPRVNCAAHIEMGCPANDNYYVINGNQVVRTLCQ